MVACLDYDVDESGLDLEFEENSISREDLSRIVSVYIDNYFKEKNVPLGVDLFSPKYIDMCIDTNICDAVDKIYSAINSTGKFETSSNEHSISEDIRFVIKTLGQIKKHVPQEFSAGVLLMHVEILEGIQLLTEI
jgi:hypothetical protein